MKRKILYKYKRLKEYVKILLFSDFNIDDGNDEYKQHEKECIDTEQEYEATHGW